MTQHPSITARTVPPAPTAPRPLARRQVLAAAAATAAAVGLPGLGAHRRQQNRVRAHRTGRKPHGPRHRARRRVQDVTEAGLLVVIVEALKVHQV